MYTSDYSQQKELKERKAFFADYKEHIVPVFEKYSAPVPAAEAEKTTGTQSIFTAHKSADIER